MRNIFKKTWRESASLIVVARQCQEVLSGGAGGGANYDVLLQTRGKEASSFANSVVFPGGVTESADASAEWVQLIKSFGFPQAQFDALHSRRAAVTPIFQDDPVQRHISLRITAIRETFEELGILICSQDRSGQKRSIWADHSTQFDVKQWQHKVSKDPEELFNLCSELNCYPDIWSLHYWSDWLTPSSFEKRFDTAFFVTALKDKPADIQGSSEVANFEWSSPSDILERNRKGEVILFPPQTYEFNRLLQLPDIEDLISFAKERSCHGSELFYPVILRAKDGFLHLLPGDELYPKTIEGYNDETIISEDKTVEQLRENCSVIHRFERTKSRSEFVIKNFKPLHHIIMEDKVIQVHN